VTPSQVSCSEMQVFVIGRGYKTALSVSNGFFLTVPRSPLRQIRCSCAAGIFLVFTMIENIACKGLYKLAISLVAFQGKE